jgi:hypothetical protein
MATLPRTGVTATPSRLRGIDLLHDPTRNKSTAYTEAEARCTRNFNVDISTDSSTG